MAYNLEPLISILNQMLNPDHNRLILDHMYKPQIESLLEKASSLNQILENYASLETTQESLETQIRDAAHKAEDVIESHIADRMLSKPKGENITFLTKMDADLQQVIQELENLKIKMMDYASQTPDYNPPSRFSSKLVDSSFKNSMVGQNEDLLRLSDRLTRDRDRFKIIPIVGMGGIGKTTLARNIYNDQRIVEEFNIRAWITVSHDYNMREILLNLLRHVIGNLCDELLEKKYSELEVELHKSLIGRTYLIVLDDIWNFKTWDGMRRFFPNEGNGSGLVLTTRIVDVAKYVSPSSELHKMRILDNSNSWNLLKNIVFGEENCPHELEKNGRKIATNCRGLPLAIHVIGGLLLKSERTEKIWEHVANDVISSVLAEKNEHFSKILSLSYNHLPHYLKPCFLYMGAFPNNYEVRGSKLIRLWIAEGLIRPVEDKSLEYLAEEYLKALVDRNLIFIRRYEEANFYSVHDLVRDLCVIKASEEKFISVKNWKKSHEFLKEYDFAGLRRVSANPSYCLLDIGNAKIEQKPLVRSFLCMGHASHDILSDVIFSLSLLRVLDILDIEFHDFPMEILKLVNLHYLAIHCNISSLPSAISRFWNLQTLILWSNLSLMDVASELWELSKLRHVKFKKTIIWIEDGYKRLTSVQKELQTISTTNLYGLIESGFIKRIPNIRKLGIFFDFSPDKKVDLSHLHKLESLKCVSLKDFRSILIFPPFIRKLSLSKCFMPWELLTMIGSLPNLEVLKIRQSNFQGVKIKPTDGVWELREGEFCSIQFLLLEEVNLVDWIVNENSFSRLRHLIIRGCEKLKGIPSEIGESTLEMIELDKPSASVKESALQIQKDQHEQGNDNFKVNFVAVEGMMKVKDRRVQEKEVVVEPPLTWRHNDTSPSCNVEGLASKPSNFTNEGNKKDILQRSVYLANKSEGHSRSQISKVILRTRKQPVPFGRHFGASSPTVWANNRLKFESNADGDGDVFISGSLYHLHSDPFIRRPSFDCQVHLNDDKVDLVKGAEDSYRHAERVDLFRCLSCFSIFIPSGFALFRIFRKGRENENEKGSQVHVDVVIDDQNRENADRDDEILFALNTPTLRPPTSPQEEINIGKAGVLNDHVVLIDELVEVGEDEDEFERPKETYDAFCPDCSCLITKFILRRIDAIEEESEDEVIELEYKKAVEKVHTHTAFCPYCNSQIALV